MNFLMERMEMNSTYGGRKIRKNGLTSKILLVAVGILILALIQNVQQREHEGCIEHQWICDNL